MSKYQELENLIDGANSIGVKVRVERSGSRVQAHFSSRLGDGSVVVNVSENSYTGHTMIHAVEFNRNSFPRKGYGVVSMPSARIRVECLRDYTLHTHCRLTHHECGA